MKGVRERKRGRASASFTGGLHIKPQIVAFSHPSTNTTAAAAALAQPRALFMAQNDSSKRAASMLTIAQHKFKQALKKEDIDVRLPPVAVELSSQFLSDLQAALKQDTPANVQVSDYKAIDHLARGAD